MQKQLVENQETKDEKNQNITDTNKGTEKEVKSPNEIMGEAGS